MERIYEWLEEKVESFDLTCHRVHRVHPQKETTPRPGHNGPERRCHSAALAVVGRDGRRSASSKSVFE